ncbi:MAG: beta-ketoacyl-[acyl-carrier-protein] synthase family protein [Bacteroidales bacterium]|nr:beta-ketoacyl-[acyl-carrier-protein] synthase family protein [Bacteroidales bacterium]
MSEKVFVTGIGIVSAIGINVNEVFQSLLELKTGIGQSSFLESIYKDEIPVAEVKLHNDALRDLLSLTSKDKHYTRASLLGILAAGEAIRNAHLLSDKKIRTGFISSTSVGGMDRTELFFKDYLINTRKGRLREVAGHDCGSSTEDIARFFNITDFATTISTACSSSANAIMLGSRMIKNNLLDRVVVGGVDALTRFTLNGFNTLMILDRKPCRPFDETRSGLNIGEGAAYMVLEAEHLAVKNSKEIFAEVKGFGNACDAFHQTASSPEGTGPRLAMHRALKNANLNPQEISYVNVHGTGTPNNDLSEGIALENVFDMKVPPFSSTKQFTGHTLGAAGSIEAVLSMLALKHNIIYPNLNHGTQMKELSIKPVTQIIRNLEVKNVLSNSFGFGGNNTTLIFSKY